jgi:enamine deaminase RidA (YjgF/YER057c/UK114 family)
MKEIIPAWMKPIYDGYHFAPAVVDGDYVRCSGMIGMRPDLTVSSDPSEQFMQAFENLRGLLEEAGATFRDVVEINSYHVGLQANMPAFLAAKDKFLSAPHAAWTAIGISELAVPGALVEIQVIARRAK